MPNLKLLLDSIKRHKVKWNPFKKHKSNKQIVQELRWWYEHELGLIEEHKSLSFNSEDCDLTLEGHESLVIEIESILGIT